MMAGNFSFRNFASPARLVCSPIAGKPGWVPAAYATRVAEQVAMYRDDVAAIEAEPPRPRGRPRKVGP